MAKQDAGQEIMVPCDIGVVRSQGPLEVEWTSRKVLCRAGQ